MLPREKALTRNNYCYSDDKRLRYLTVILEHTNKGASGAVVSICRISGVQSRVSKR